MDIAIGYFIKKVTEEKKMSTLDLAMKLGISRGSVSRLFGYKSVQTDFLKQICVALDYDFFAILSKYQEIKKVEVKGVSECEKLLEERTAELEAVKKEMVYLKEINELLRGRK